MWGPLIGLIIIAIVVFVGLLLRRSRKDYEHETAEKKTVEEILIKTKQQTREQLDKMKPEEKMEKWKKLYGEEE